MLSYTTTIDVKKREIQTTFGKETRTFMYNGFDLTVLDVLRLAAEDFHNQLLELLARMVEHAERTGQELPPSEPYLYGTPIKLPDGREAEAAGVEDRAMLQAITLLARAGVVSTFEYPGYISIQMGPRGCLNVGKANGYYSADFVDQEQEPLPQFDDIVAKMPPLAHDATPTDLAAEILKLIGELK